MRKLFFTFMAFMLFLSSTATAQVTIGSDEAPATSAILDLKNLPDGKADKGMVIPRVENISVISNPINGMMVYDLSTNCFKIYQNQTWSECAGAYVAPPNFTALPYGTATLTGKTYFDIARSNSNEACGLLENRQNNKSDFTQTATNTQTYTFTSQGTVSNVRFYYLNTNGTPIISISGGNGGNDITTPVKAIVKYSPLLNKAAFGLTKENSIKAEIYAVYTDDATGTDYKVQLNIDIVDCLECGAYIAPNVWKRFMCHNLGADPTADPSIPSWKINGAYIQWGKRGPTTDWQTAPNNGPGGFAAAPTGPSASEANSGAIAGWNTTYNYNPQSWNSGTEDNPIKTANDPCPAGYRVPTKKEWDGVIANNTKTHIGTWTNSPTAHTSYTFALKLGDVLSLPAAGYRINNAGELFSRSYYGRYWSSLYYSSIYAYDMYFYPGGVNTYYHAHHNGLSVRCVAE